MTNETVKTDRDNRDQWRKMDREERTDFGTHTRKLGVADEVLKKLEAEGVQPRWINDTNHGQRLREAIKGGYSFVDANGDAVTKDDKHSQNRRYRYLVGTQEGGAPTYAYLMAIPKEWKAETDAKKAAIVNQSDAAIRRGEAFGPGGKATGGPAIQEQYGHLEAPSVHLNTKVNKNNYSP